MKICVIDPGPTESAYVCWDTERHCFYLPSNSTSDKGIVDTLAMIARLQNVKAPDMYAIEMIQSYGMPAGRSVFETALNVGRFIEAAHSNSPFTPVKLYGRPTIKGQIGGRTDAEIRASLRLRYGDAKKGEKLEGVRKDIWAALALAVALEENPRLKEW